MWLRVYFFPENLGLSPVNVSGFVLSRVLEMALIYIYSLILSMIVVIILHLYFIYNKLTQKILIYNCNTALKHKNFKTGLATYFTIRKNNNGFYFLKYPIFPVEFISKYK